MAQLKNTVASLTEIINRMKAETTEVIQGIKEPNHDISVISDTPRIFTVSSNTLTRDLVLDPFYYDWEAQYDAILTKLNKQSLDTFIRTVSDACKTGRLDGRRLHPEVIKKLVTLIEEEPA